MPKARNVAAPNSRAHRRPPATAARAALVDLPGSGCDLPIPDLPEGWAWTDHDRGRWEELWKSPQATAWDETCRGTVAVLIVYESMILSGAANAWHAQECRYASEALGLTPKAMAALGWRIVDGVE